VARGILGDWQVSLIYQAQSGFPFTISVFGDTANASSLLNVNPIRANAVPGVSPELPSDERSMDRWFNTVNYATPNRFVDTPQFGTITEPATAARQIQFVLRATF
jgi:hypothetical protein